MPPLHVEDARARVLAQARELGAETVALANCLGRVLAQDVPADADHPGFDNSAMDGYAVLARDVAGASDERPVELTVAGESRAGHPARAAVEPGTAIGISTGAVMPAGADSVVRVEDTSDADGRVRVEVAVSPGANVRRAGDDVRAGEMVVPAGAEIGPAELGALALVGATEVACRRRPRVAVLTSGDELRPPGTPLAPGQIRDTNGPAVAALAARAGAVVTDVANVGDDREGTVAAVERGLRADVLVICGGVSVGAHDHVKPALARAGVEEDFWRVALRPGHPTWFGVRSAFGGRPTLVFGLPGNPVSTMVTFLLFARPALAVLGGRDPAARRVTAALDEPYSKPAGRTHAVRCRLELRDDGWHATLTGPQGSHVLTSMVGADGLALIEADRAEVQAGDQVTVELIG